LVAQIAVVVAGGICLLLMHQPRKHIGALIEAWICAMLGDLLIQKLVGACLGLAVASPRTYTS
jgi:hypothetical protein